ncbi:MAG: hypothetical protein ABFS42_09095 [Candidatus Krumholzibacteriota bacterium]
MSLFDDVKKNLVEWYGISSEKTAEVARVTTRRYDKFGISRDIERQFSELGSLVYNGLKEGRQDLQADPAVLALAERIKGLEDELRAKSEEIEEIQREYTERRTRTAESAAAGGAAEDTVVTPEPILSQPVLDEGGEESAILVEPVVVDVEDPGLDESPKEGNGA